MISEIKHVLIVAGGTGGHVYPALAVADYLIEKNIKVTWVGTKKGLEYRIVSATNIALELISINGLRGKGFISWLFAPLKLSLAILQAVKVCLKVKPDAVLGMGGFVSGPMGLAAFILNKPLYLHEQNAIPGLTNRVLCHLATGVMQAFPNSFKGKNNIIETGNPVRNNINGLAAPIERMATHKGKIRLLIMGGSLGAQALNEIVPVTLSLLANALRPEVWHQAGKGKKLKTEQHYKQLNVTAKITEFIEDMAEAYAWADLVICRAGALTVSELANIGIASILVPYPYAVDDHQTANARFLVNENAAVLIPQKILTKTLLNVLTELLSMGRTKLLEMAEAARKLAKPDATKTVATICLGQTHD